MTTRAAHGSAGLPPYTPGAGLKLLREVWGDDRIPVVTPEVEARTSEIIEEARRRTGQHKAA